MKVLAHLDPAVLERELLERVAAARDASPLARTVVLVPTARLAAHVQRRLLERRDAWLNVHVLHFRALAMEILGEHGARTVELLSPRLLEALLRRLVARGPASSWSRFVSQRPGAMARLSSSFRELREAGIEPGALDACHGGRPRNAELATLYRSYCDALASLARTDRVDETALVRAAIPHAEAYARGCSAVFLHGVYELIGIHLELLRAVDRERTIDVLLLAEPGARVTAYAETFARAHLLGTGGELDRLGDASAPDRSQLLRALFDEDARQFPPAPGRFSFRHTQGATAEVKLAVRGALAAVAGGCPPGEVVITARGLTPYAAALEEIFRSEGLPWSTSLRVPLRRHPAIHDLLRLLRVVAEDFPRRSTVACLRSPRLAWQALLDGAPVPSADCADRFSRQSGLIGGLTEWTDELEAWAAVSRARDDANAAQVAAERLRTATRIEECRRIGAALSALRERVAPERSRSWSAHAREVRALARAVLDARDPGIAPALDVLDDLLDDMRALETVIGETGAVPLPAMLAWLEHAVDGTTVPLRPHDDGSLRVLDAMQLRGITCRRLFVLGLNTGQFPLPQREDPILDDALRLRLRQATGQPLPVKGHAFREERLLLATLLGSATEHVAASWQRADEAGRARTPSLALRELARLTLGRPAMEELIATAEPLPSHPTLCLEALAVRPGLLSGADECLLSVLGSRGPVPELDGWFPELTAGLTMLRATESFHATRPEYDARVGAGREPPVHAVSSLETLARCPLQYFFRHVLHVRELDEEATAFEIARRELGVRAHGLLEQVHRRLQEERRSPTELLAELWPQHMGDLGRRMARRVPALWTMLESAWIGALARFLEEDVARIRRESTGPLDLECEVQREVDLGGGSRIAVRGRFDRSFPREGRLVVGDYKTGRLGAKGDITAMLRGADLQVALYWLMAGAEATVELLGVGPDHDPARGDDAPPHRIVFAGFENPVQHEGFLETVRTVQSLAQQGCFPLHSGRHCDWCAYALACRRKHPPTLAREEDSPASADYRLLGRKTKRDKPTLAAVRRRPDEHGDD